LALKTLLAKDDRHEIALKLVKVRGTERAAVARKAIVKMVRVKTGKEK